MTVQLKDQKSENVSPARPISPPFVFRDPEDPSKIYGIAHNLKELATNIKLIPYFSIEYHTQSIDENLQISNDLALWLKYVIGVEELAAVVEEYANIYKGLELKNKLIELFNQHIFDEA